MKQFKRYNVGQQPRSQLLKTMLIDQVNKRHPDEVVVIHHFTDTEDRLQLEVERRSKTLGITFERIFLK